mmetsp:Transcript_19716/g.54179  ORF Transcript_19716/g.54179 Transcript_19716/m.54179 type:complete len:507 (+) Transcript_19716:57-1577(+)|eukprot:CAMPEP_0117527964 /NCGR_PEP_ID=MMETSP0784-20121206/37070_1 /TAXON_ID=39447 /ORGANISM="" /LENGTH=506 /DNA_ID=CAMNT_0005324235 /DNA_START=30 /DNA_END=1550 /DNA_ORIENTATION=+
MSFGWLWGANDLDENQEVEHESGGSRLCGSIFAALCCTPVLLILTVVLLGWNEQRAVCDSKAIATGKDVVTEVGCDAKGEGNGELVMFSCDMSKDGLPGFTPGGAFDTVLSSYVGTGLSVKSEMRQCIENVQSQTKKDNVGGGKTTIKTYTYSVEWKASYVDSGPFRHKEHESWRQNCGVENPQWPFELPTTQTLYADQVNVGDFTLDSEYVKDIPLDTVVTGGSIPEGWALTGSTYSTSKFRQGLGGIGDVKVSFSGTDWANPRITVLGKNSGGSIASWTAPSSWLCSGYSLQDVRTGTVDKDMLFANLQAEARNLTWILRLVGFIIAWIAFALLAGPLEVVADCIPCIGPYLGDSVQAIACCVACLPACACAMGVIGIVWVAMRPFVGIPLIVVFCCGIGGLVVFKIYSKQQKNGGGGGGAAPQTIGSFGSSSGGSAPVAPHVASGFIQALRQEYVNGVDGAVGNFFDGPGCDDAQTLAPYEDSIRSSGNPAQAISDLQQKWGV